MTQQGMETDTDSNETVEVPTTGNKHKMRNTFSSRLLFGGWFFFTIIVVATYTANLATFFVADTIPTGIQSVDELADQTNVQYGTVIDSAAERFFHTSSIDKYRKMGNFMKKTKDVMVANAHEGYERVRNNSGRYVFIWDDLSLGYAVSTSPHCNTRLIGRDFDKRGYGIGMRQGQPYRRNFTTALLQLKDDGSVEKLRDQWITKAGACQPNEQEGDNVGRPQPLKLKAFGGAFVILAAAVGLAVISWGCFWLYRRLMDRRQ